MHFHTLLAFVAHELDDFIFICNAFLTSITLVVLLVLILCLFVVVYGAQHFRSY